MNPLTKAIEEARRVRIANEEARKEYEEESERTEAREANLRQSLRDLLTFHEFSLDPNTGITRERIDAAIERIVSKYANTQP